MATFLNIRTTDAGQALLADVHTGAEVLTITEVAFGNGLWDEADHSAMNMTTLKNQIWRVTPTGFSQKGGEAEITCELKNTGLDTGFALTEIGVIALRENGDEVLYMADAVPSAQSTWISSENDHKVTIPVTLRIVCSSSSEVIVRVESTASVTTKDLDNHNKADDAHANIRQELQTHDHDSAYYTRPELSGYLNEISATRVDLDNHNHDIEYYTRAELDVYREHNHHDQYYTKAQSDEIWTHRMPPGHMYLLPFTPAEFPLYHYYPNGDGLLKTSEEGKTLLSMSTAYKTLHNVIEKGDYVHMPDMTDTVGPSYAPGIYLPPLGGE